MNGTLGILLLNPLLPYWAMAVCLLVFAVCAWRTYGGCSLNFGRRLFLFSLRVAAFLIICWLLMRPVERSLDVLEEKATVAVVIDESASMEDKLPGMSKTRAERAMEFLQSSEMARLARRCQVLSYRLGDGLTRGGKLDERPAFGAGQSRLLTGLQELRTVTKSERPFAAIVLTDGLDTSGLGFDGMVFDVPYLIPELEDASELKEDTRVEYSVSLPDSHGPRRVVKGWKTSVRVTVNRLRGNGEAQVPVALLQDGQELEVREVPFKEGARYAQTTFEFTPDKLGHFACKVVIRPKDDQDADNNEAEFVLEVTDEDSRVLYLEGMVRQEFKFMKRALQKERAIQTAVYVSMAGGVFLNFEDSEDPRNSMDKILTEENLKRYKVLVLGEFAGEAFSDEQIAAIRKFVDKGGGLLLCGGAKAYGENGYLGEDRLGPLSPMTSETGAAMSEGKARPIAFTAAGRNDRSFMKLASEAAFSPLGSLWAPVKLSSGAVTIIESGDGEPVFVTRRYGEGRVCAFLSNTLHTLRLHGASSGGISIYDRLVCQAVFSMLPDIKKEGESDALQILLKGDNADTGQKVQVGALAGSGKKAGDLTCEVTLPDGNITRYPMQAAMLEAQVGLANARKGFLSEFKAQKAGTYQLEIVCSDGQRSEKKLLVVRRPVLEMTGEPVNRTLLKKLAELSKGRFLPLGEQGDLLAGLTIPERRKERVSEATQWDSWWWLVPLMALFCLEWYFRRHWDLV